MKNNAILSAARAYVGTQEWPGAQHNPVIVEFAAAAGAAWVQDDETPWCASFVGAVLAQVGLPNTGKLNARSYLDWGDRVQVPDAQPGDIVVFWRGARDGWQGHVGFLVGWDGDNPIVLGGNQGDAVSIKPYPRNRLLQVRRAKMPRKSPMQSTTVRASTVTAVAGGAGGVLAGVAKMEPMVQAVLAGGAVLIMLLSLYILRERLKAWAGKGQR